MKRTLLIILLFAGCSKNSLELPTTKTAADSTAVRMCDSLVLSDIPIDFNVSIDNWDEQ